MMSKDSGPKKQVVGSRRLKLFASSGLVLALLLGACQAAPPAATPASAPAVADTPVPTDTPAPMPAEDMTPGVTVSDQPIENDMVTIAKVVSSGPGWLVVHADKDGAPGPVLGYTAVADGENSDVKVKLAAEGRTEKLFAMLHTDAGVQGTYEFPGPDVPVTVSGSVAVVPFQVTGGMGAATPTEPSPAAAEQAQVKLANFAFSPAQLTVKAGTTVVWTSEDSASHTVTADDGSFNSGTLHKGDSFSFTFTKPGEYAYYCRFHGGPGGAGMAGSVVVTE
jgi:plastocyanin